MSIIQEALKKAQVDYQEKKAPRNIKVKAPPRQKISLPKVDVFKKITLPKINVLSRIRLAPLPNIRISTTILSISVVSMLLASALGLKIFIMYKGGLNKEKNITQAVLPKEAPPVSLADMVAPVSFARPKTEPVAAPAKPENPAPVFILNGIMYLESKPQAIINGYMLEEGDSLNGATVVVIDKDYVLLNLKDDKVRLNLKY